MHALFSTCDLCDAHRDALHSDALRVLPPVFRSFGKISRFRGQIATVQCHMKRALLGGNLAALASQNGWAGVLVNGCVRDVHEILQVPIGVLALASMPAPPEKHGKGMVDAVVNIQDVIVRPGEWLYADEDGVIISRGQLGLAL